MKPVPVSLLFGMLALNAAVLAQPNPHTDQIGMYFDEEATINCISPAPVQETDIYFAITNPTAPCIAGCCFQFDIQPDPWFVTGLYFDCWPYSGIPADEGVDLPLDCTVYLEPYPAVSVVVLGHVRILTINEDPLYFHLRPCSIYDTPVYWCESWDDTLPLYSATGTNAAGEWNAVACMHCDCLGVIPVAEATWGTLKALYR